MVKYSWAITELIAKNANRMHAKTFFTWNGLKLYFNILCFLLILELKKFAWFKTGHVGQYYTGELLDRCVVVSYRCIIITAGIPKVSFNILQCLLQFKENFICFQIRVTFFKCQQTFHSAAKNPVCLRG